MILAHDEPVDMKNTEYELTRGKLLPGCLFEPSICFERVPRDADSVGIEYSGIVLSKRRAQPGSLEHPFGTFDRIGGNAPSDDVPVPQLELRRRYALVRLLVDTADYRVSAVADSAGRYQIIAPTPGRYRVRAERLGYEPRESEAFDVDTTTEVLIRDLRLRPSPIPVSGVEVTADVVNRRISRFLGMSAGQLRIRPVSSATIREHAMRGDDLSELIVRRNIPNLQVLRSRAGPCFQFRGRDCLPVFLDGARLSRSASRMPPLEMLSAVVILLPSAS